MRFNRSHFIFDDDDDDEMRAPSKWRQEIDGDGDRNTDFMEMEMHSIWTPKQQRNGMKPMRCCKSLGIEMNRH